MDKWKKPAVPQTTLMSQRLFQQAERDMRLARRLLDPEGYYLAANLAHQVAEKSLKAAHWHLLGEEPPWKHNLVQLAERVAGTAVGLPPEVNSAVIQLSPMFERSRYPSGNVSDPIPADLIGEEEARTSIRSAEEVVAWVRSPLQRPPGRARRETD